MTGWYVVYTHAHAEARALENLERQGFTAYLPRYRRRRRHARRTEEVTRPLFPRYLFVALDMVRERWRPILSTVGVSGVVRHGELPTRVPAGVVEAIRAHEAKGAFDRLSPADGLRHGDPVRIVEGPFAELIGRFCGLADRERVIVLLEFLGRQVRAKVPAEAIAAA